jgi:23S rRNA pseudouridine2605 synthase
MSDRRVRPVGPEKVSKPVEPNRLAKTVKPTERLQKTLAHAGVASRRACEALITAGRVAVNGQVVTHLGAQVAASDQVSVDGKPVGGDAPLTYVMLNKPTGYVTTAKDPEGRPTVLDLVRGPRRVTRLRAAAGRGVGPATTVAGAAPERTNAGDAQGARGVAARLYPVGRLDVDSEGLVLLTNDGDMSLHLTHPRYEQEKEYRVLVEGVPDEKVLDRLRQGIDLDGRLTAPARVRALQSAPEPDLVPVQPRTRGKPGVAPAPPVAEPRSTWLSVVIHEGRQRQVRRMCLTVGLPVRRLVRVRMAGLCLGNLPLGDWRFLTEAEIKLLKPAPAPGVRPAARFRPRQRNAGR